MAIFLTIFFLFIFTYSFFTIKSLRRINEMRFPNDKIQPALKVFVIFNLAVIILAVIFILI